MEVNVKTPQKGVLENKGVSKEEYIKRYTQGSKGIYDSDGPEKWIIYLGVNPLRPEEEYVDRHGLRFKKNYVYRVSPEVFEFIKAIRGFAVVRDVKTQMTDFPKKGGDKHDDGVSANKKKVYSSGSSRRR